MKNPNLLIQGISVLICTPVMQAGQSLDGNIHKVFSFFDRGILTHEMEHQMMLRCRSWADMEDPEIFVQRGCSGRMQASYLQQLKATRVYGYDDDELMQTAEADVLGEKADSVNRHVRLWHLNRFWKVIQLKDIEIESEQFSQMKRVCYRIFNQWNLITSHLQHDLDPVRVQAGGTTSVIQDLI